MRLWALLGWGWAAASPPAPAAAPPDVDFRCSQLSLQSEGQGAQASGDIVVRLRSMDAPTLLMCCEQLQIPAASAQDAGRTEPLTCRGDVRLWRAGLLLWADQVVVDVAGASAEFTGRPLAQRGDSHVAAERISLNLRLGEIGLRAPHGSLTPASVAPADAAGPELAQGALPARCPLPPRPPQPRAGPPPATSR